MNKIHNYLFITVFLFVLAPMVMAQQKKPDISNINKPIFVKTVDVNKKTSGVETKVNKIETFAPINFPSDKKGYGMILFDTVYANRGYSSFKFNDPKTFTLDNAKVNTYAGASGFNKYYYLTYAESSWGEIVTYELNVMDQSNGQISTIMSLGELTAFLMGLTFDYSKNVLYAIKLKDAGSDLVKIDYKKKECSIVGSFGGIQFLTLATTYKGELYGLANGGWLYRINKENASLVKVGNTQFAPNYVQSMEFDHSDETLYWASFSENNGTGLRLVDVNSGISNKISDLGRGAQVTGLHIPFTAPSVDVPNQPENVSRVTGDSATKNVTLSWKNPTKDFGGAVLSSLVKTEIYRNSELIHTINTPVVGKEEQWKDVNGIDGYSTYKIVSTNLDGTGVPALLTVYVGKDLPGSIENLKAMRSNGIAQITWQAPIAGKKGGQYDKNSLVYRIVRLPDQKVLTSSCTDTSFTDAESMSQLTEFYYAVQAIDQNGEGDYSYTQGILLGQPESVPFYSDFETQTDFDRWMVVDNNHDIRTWRWINGSDEDPEGKDVRAAAYWFSVNPSSSPDDWLVSSPIYLEKDIPYQLTFGLRAALPECPERVKVFIGNTHDITKMNEIGDCTVSDTAGFKSFRVLLPTIAKSEEFYIAFQACSESQMYVLELKNVLLEKRVAGNVKGTVTGDGTPVVGAVIKIKGDGENRSFVTDNSGCYSIDYIEPGNHVLGITKHGFIDLEKQITVGNSQELKLDISLEAISLSKVVGRILDAQGKIIPDAFIYVKGYDRYSGVTTLEGKFELSGIYKTGSYTLMVMKSGYKLAEKTFSFTGEKYDIGDLSLELKNLSPGPVKVEVVDAAMNLTWDIPVDTYLFRYDGGGAPKGVIGTQAADNSLNTRAVAGTVYRTPAILTGMSFFLPRHGGPKDFLRTYVFDLDKNGDPVSEPLFKSDPMSCTEEVWTEFVFPEPVVAPNGFMVAVSYPGDMVYMARDESKEVPPRTQCFATDYKAGDFYYMDLVGGRMMMRAEGAVFESFPLKSMVSMMETGNNAVQDVPLVEIGEKASSGSISYSYIVSRLKAGEERNPEKWMLLTTDKVNEAKFSDKAWGSLQQGIYRYAVQTVYNDGQKSAVTFSDSLYSKMIVSVTIKVESQKQIPLEGAEVVFTSTDGKQQYRSNTNGQGNAALSVIKGRYNMLIHLDGFNDYIKNNIDLLDVGTYNPQACVMVESLIQVHDLVVEEEGTECSLYWNMPNISESFEGHTDFAINSPGSLGWKYLDGDAKKTTGLSGYNFPGAGSEMAYIVFNPYKTNPPMVQQDEASPASPHNGEKFLASMAALGTGSDALQNDDYIISPVLRYSGPFTLGFWAKTYNTRYGSEMIRVGYSEKGTEKADFKWLKRNIEVPGAWMEYTYTVPAGARYITINCVSPDMYMLMLDDIFIGNKEKNSISRAHSYEVYLDDQLQGTTNTPDYKLARVSAGKHTAGVKAIYDSGASEMTKVEFESTGASIKSNNGESDVLLYPSPAVDFIYIDGDYQEIRMFHSSGELQGIYKGVNSIAVSGWRKGVYAVQIVKVDKVIIKKIELK